MGKASFTEQKLLDNFAALMEAVQQAKPTGVKGSYIKRTTLCATMGPGIKVDTAQAVQLKVE